jgi:hypothetical protein
MTEERDYIELISKIAERGLHVINELGHRSVKKLDLMMDVEYTHEEAIPLDLEQFLNFPNGDFAHDITGIYYNFNRETKEMDNFFVPRCALRES